MWRLAVYGIVFAVLFVPVKTAALGTQVDLVDKTRIQLLAFGLYVAQDGTDRDICFAYVGTRNANLRIQEAVNLADQAFEELIAQECAARFLRHRGTGKVRIVPTAWVTVGPDIVLMESPDGWLYQQLSANPLGFRVEYGRSDDVGADVVLDARGRPTKEFLDAEFVRVSHSDIPVAASKREPNLVPQSTEIKPGVTIDLENVTDIIYIGHRRPTVLVYYRTDILIDDIPAIKRLAGMVAAHVGGHRLQERELEGIRTIAFNEPKRSRFHYRRAFWYYIDRKGRIYSDGGVGVDMVFNPVENFLCSPSVRDVADCPDCASVHTAVAPAECAPLIPVAE